MEAWIRSVMDTMGYPGVALLMFLENLIPPIPSELIMPAAGYAASRRGSSLLGIIIAGSLGSVLGQLPLYWIGSKFGRRRSKRFADRYGRWVLITGEDLDRADHWLTHYGKSAVLLCRLVPGLRSLISIPAGITHMPLPTFLLLTSLGTIVWTSLLAWLGSLLGQNHEQVSKFLGPVATVVMAGVILLFVGCIGWRYWKAYQSRSELEADESR